MQTLTKQNDAKIANDVAVGLLQAQNEAEIVMSALIAAVILEEAVKALDAARGTNYQQTVTPTTQAAVNVAQTILATDTELAELLEAASLIELRLSATMRAKKLQTLLWRIEAQSELVIPLL